MRAGWRRGKSSSCARNAVGVGVSLRPRPLRESGWETTRPTSCSEATSRFRIVAAKSGVPAKATLTAWGVSALGEQALAHLAHSGLAGLPISAVQDQDPIQVVYLVLEDPREQARGLDAERGTCGVLPGDRHAGGPLDLDLDARYRETAFDHLLRGLGDLLYQRVHDDVLLFFGRGDQDPLQAAYLVGGETHPLVLAHGDQHLLSQVRERLVEGLDRRGASLEHWVSERPDIECHLYTSSGSTSTRTFRPRTSAGRRAARVAARATVERSGDRSKTLQRGVPAPCAIGTGPDISTPGFRADLRRDSTAQRTISLGPSSVTEARCAKGG